MDSIEDRRDLTVHMYDKLPDSPALDTHGQHLLYRFESLRRKMIVYDRLSICAQDSLW